MPNKQAFLADKTAFDEAMVKLTKHLNTNYYIATKEWHYGDIEPRVFAEELLGADLQDTSKNLGFENDDFQTKAKAKSYKAPDDYKVNQCHERTLFVEIDSNRFENHTRAMFDEHFVKLPFQFSCENLPITKEVKIVQKFDTLIMIAKILGRDFDYVRVDLYETNSKIYAGELTFTPGGGTSRFKPSKYDEEFGRLWVSSTAKHKMPNNPQV